MGKIDILKERKKLLNITFEELAQKSGIPLRTLENIFHGVTKNPRIDTMQAIERALGLEEEKTPSDGLSEDERKLIELIKKLSSEEVDEISSFVDYVISKRKN